MGGLLSLLGSVDRCGRVSLGSVDRCGRVCPGVGVSVQVWACLGTGLGAARDGVGVAFDEAVSCHLADLAVVAGLWKQPEP